MKQYTNDPDNPKTDSPLPVPDFIYREVTNQLEQIHSIVCSNLSPEEKTKAISHVFDKA